MHSRFSFFCFIIPFFVPLGYLIIILDPILLTPPTALPSPPLLPFPVHSCYFYFFLNTPSGRTYTYVRTPPTKTT
ncbi:hypothetical protein DFH27DRAFT_532397, partial [Peziza echinospora]